MTNNRSRRYARRKRMGKWWLLLGVALFAMRYAAGAASPTSRGLARLAEQVGVGGDAPAGAGVPRASGRLRLASWNLQWLAEREGSGPVKRQASDYARLARYARSLAADVVAVQEVESARALERLFPPDLYAAYLAPGRGRQRAGFVVRRALAVRVHAPLDDLALGGRLRAGADLSVRVGASELRLLSVHLKARCPRGPLAGEQSCRTLAQQAQLVEGWIDERQRAGEAFAVLGDFNRELSKDDAIWRDWDDGEPAGLVLRRAGEGRAPGCWGGRYQRYIDHIVLGGPAAGWLVPGGFGELVYDAGERRRGLSDHCPIFGDLAPPARRAP